MRPHPLILAAAFLCTVSFACRSSREREADPRLSSPEAEIAILEDGRKLGDGKLVAFLVDPNPEVRARAAVALGRIGDPAAAPALREALEDFDRAVRIEVIFALGQIPDRGAGEALLQILESDPDPEVRGVAAEALGKLGDPGIWPALIERAAAEADPGVRGEIALAFWRAGLPEDPSVREAGRAALLGMFEDPDPEVRWRAVYAVVRGKMIDPACREALLRVAEEPARHPEGWDRVFAVRGLGDQGVRQDVDLLFFILTESTLERGKGPQPDWPLRVEALASIERLGPIDPASAAVGIAMNCAADDVACVRVQAIRLLGALGKPGLGDLAQGAWAEAEELGQVVRQAGSIEFAERERQTIALNVLNEPSWLARAEAARAFRELPADLALSVLESLFGDEDIRVKTAVVEALGPFGADPRAHGIMRRALKTNDLAVRGTAVSVLIEWNDPLWKDDLVRAFRKSKGLEMAEVRALAIDALASLGDAAPTEFFRNALDDPQPMVRAHAAAVLEARGEGPVAFARIHATKPLGVSRLLPLEGEAAPRVLVRTDRGDFVIELFHREAPVHCRGFLSRVKNGYYDGLIFHRVVPDFVVQGGDPRGDGWGGGDRFVREQIHRGKFLRGTVGMPTSGKDTGGVQFFVTHCPTPHLDGRYTAFGRVVEGMEVVDRIERGDRIVSATIVEPSPEAAPEKGVDLDPEGAFRALEERLLTAGSVHVAFSTRTEGMVESEFEGELTIEGREVVRLAAEGTFRGTPVRIRFDSDGKRMAGGNEEDTFDEEVPAGLVEGILVGFMRMGLVHNLAMLSQGSPPDYTDGRAREHLTVAQFTLDERVDDERVVAPSFVLGIDGEMVARGTLWIDVATGLPVRRTQTVYFDAQKMSVVENYAVFEAE